MKSFTFRIEGMHCDGCARTIMAVIGTEPGVHAAEVSYKSGEARVVYDPQITAEHRLAELIEKIGYDVVARSP